MSADGAEPRAVAGVAAATRSPVAAVGLIMASQTLACLSFYGMVSIIAVYLLQLKLSEQDAVTATNVFACFNFGLCILGGTVSDRWLGKFRTIVWGLVLTGAGMSLLWMSVTVLPHVPLHVVGATSTSVGAQVSTDNLQLQRWMTYASLALVALGNGLSTPTLSTFAAEQFSDKASVPSFFRWFYLSFNFGSIISTAGAPALHKYVSVATAFCFLAVGLYASVLVFVSGACGTYLRLGDRPSRRMCGRLWCGCKCCYPPRAASPAARESEPSGDDAGRGERAPASISNSSGGATEQARRRGSSMFAPGTAPSDDDKAAMWRIIKVFAPFPVFWALFMNIYGLWTFSALHLNRRVTSGYTIPAGQVQALNPTLDCLLIPLFDRVLYPAAARWRGGKPLPAITRMAVGMGFTSASLAAAAVVEFYIDDGYALPVWAQVPQYFLLSCGEIMASITGLEFAFTQAPASMRALIMALWFLTQAAGNAIVAGMSAAGFGQGGDKRLLYVGLSAAMLLFMGLFVFLNRGYKYRDDDDNETSSRDAGSGGDGVYADPERGPRPGRGDGERAPLMTGTNWRSGEGVPPPLSSPFLGRAPGTVPLT